MSFQAHYITELSPYFSTILPSTLAFEHLSLYIQKHLGQSVAVAVFIRCLFIRCLFMIVKCVQCPVHLIFEEHSKRGGGESSCNGLVWQGNKWRGGSWLYPGYKTPLTPGIFTHRSLSSCFGPQKISETVTNILREVF